MTQLPGATPQQRRQAINTRERARMLREVIKHNGATDRSSFEYAPISISSKASSYSDMLDDATISAAYDSIRAAVLENPHTVAPQDKNDAKSVMIANEIEQNLRDLPMETILENALSALVLGFFPHEVTWKYSGKRFALECIADLDTEQIAFELDDRMNVIAYLSQPTAEQPQRIPTGKLWLHRHRPSRAFPAGRSILDAAYRPWKAKDNLLRMWGQTLQRYGMPLVFVSLPSTADSEMESDVLTAIYNLQLDGVAILPAGVGYQIEQPPQWHGLTFEMAISFQESQIVKRLLLALSSSGGSGQTYITGDGLEAQARTTSYLLKRVSRQLCESFTDQVIRPLIYANYGERPDLVPSLMLPPPGETNLPNVAQPVAALVSAGILTAEQAANVAGFEYDEQAMIEAKKRIIEQQSDQARA